MLKEKYVSILLFITINLASGWHAYNISSILSSDKECNSNLKAVRSTRTDSIKQFDFWPGLTSDIGEVVYGYHDAMKLVWDNQHPGR